MGDDRFYAQAAGQPAVIAAVAKVLAERWDPEARFEAPDGTCHAESHASAVLGILGTGLDLAAVAGYFRRAEEAALDEAVSDGGAVRAGTRRVGANGGGRHCGAAGHLTGRCC